MSEIKQTLQQDADALLKRLQQSRKNGTGVTLSVSDVGVLCEEIDSLKAYRSDFEIIQQTIALVDLLATSTNVYQRDPSCLYPFESENPRVKEWWRTACKIQELLTNTDPENCDFDEYKKMIEAAQENSHDNSN